MSGENYPDHLTTIMSHCEKVTPESDCDEIWGRQEIFEKLNKQLVNMAFADLLLGPFSVPFYTY